MFFYYYLKKYPNLNNLVLPKSLRSSLKDDFLEKRRIELNKYLQVNAYSSLMVSIQFINFIFINLKFKEIDKSRKY